MVAAKKPAAKKPAAKKAVAKKPAAKKVAAKKPAAKKAVAKKPATTKAANHKTAIKKKVKTNSRGSGGAPVFLGTPFAARPTAHQPGAAEIAANLNAAAEPLRQPALRESNKLKEKKGERKGCR